jgi:release factor glutamine methyltransferase
MVERQTLNLLVKGSIPLRLIFLKSSYFRCELYCFYKKIRVIYLLFMDMLSLTITTLLYKNSHELCDCSSTPQLDVQLLLAYVLGCTRGQLLAMQPTHSLTEEQAACFIGLIEQRRAGLSVAYLLKEKEFYGRIFHVDLGVLVPRPDSEVLVEAVLSYAQQYKIKTLRDVGTGTGVLALTLACELSLEQVIASDVSEEAQHIFEINRDLLQLELKSPVLFTLSSLLGEQSTFYDVIVANLPYLTPEETYVRIENENWREPALALDGGEADGLQLIRKLIIEATGCCMAIFLEAAPEQMKTIAEALRVAHFSNIECFRDLSGQERVIAGYII